jgi:hypothetical protein
MTCVLFGRGISHSALLLFFLLWNGPTGDELMVTGSDLQGQLIICCRVRQGASRRWYIESAFTNRFAWTGASWESHVEGIGIKGPIASWEYRVLAEKHATRQGFVII